MVESAGLNRGKCFFCLFFCFFCLCGECAYVNSAFELVR